MNKKPSHFLVFKIAGILGLVIFIIGIIKLLTGFDDFESNDFLIGMFMMPIGLFIGFTGLMIGFRPEISKLSIKTAKYLQEENKDELKQITSTSAEIVSEALTTTVQTIKEGLKETMFCKHCGKEIDADSKFCKHCGKNI